MKLGGLGGAANCRVALQVGALSKNFRRDGEMIDAGSYRLELDSDDNGGSDLIHKARVCLYAQEVRQAPVCAAPVPQDDAVVGEDVNPDVEIPVRVLDVQDDLRPEDGATDVDVSRPPDPLGIRYWSPSEVMRNKLRLLHALDCRTKEQCWKCLLDRRGETSARQTVSSCWIRAAKNMSVILVFFREAM